MKPGFGTIFKKKEPVFTTTTTTTTTTNSQTINSKSMGKTSNNFLSQSSKDPKRRTIGGESKKPLTKSIYFMT
jgi:hypothetical protein